MHPTISQFTNAWNDIALFPQFRVFLPRTAFAHSVEVGQKRFKAFILLNRPFSFRLNVDFQGIPQVIHDFVQLECGDGCFKDINAQGQTLCIFK